MANTERRMRKVFSNAKTEALKRPAAKSRRGAERKKLEAIRARYSGRQVTQEEMDIAFLLSKLDLAIEVGNERRDAYLELIHRLKVKNNTIYDLEDRLERVESELDLANAPH